MCSNGSKSNGSGLGNEQGFSASPGGVTEFQVNKFTKLNLDSFGDHQHLDEELWKVSCHAEIQKYINYNVIKVVISACAT